MALKFARALTQSERATERIQSGRESSEREATADLYLFSTEAQGAHTHTQTRFFRLYFFYPRARIHYLFFDGALFTFLLAQLGNFSCYIKVLSQMVSPTPTSTASSSVAPPPGSAALFYGCSAPLISASCSLFKKKPVIFLPRLSISATHPTHSLTLSLFVSLISHLGSARRSTPLFIFIPRHFK